MRMRAMPCDLLVTAHPGASGLMEKLQRRKLEAAAENTLLDPLACRTYADEARDAFNQRLADESK